jgi:hypothetical protein
LVARTEARRLTVTAPGGGNFDVPLPLSAAIR